MDNIAHIYIAMGLCHCDMKRIEHAMAYELRLAAYRVANGFDIDGVCHATRLEF